MFWERYTRRAGIEGTVSQGVRTSGMRRSRYRGLQDARRVRQSLPRRGLCRPLPQARPASGCSLAPGARYRDAVWREPHRPPSRWRRAYYGIGRRRHRDSYSARAISRLPAMTSCISERSLHCWPWRGRAPYWISARKRSLGARSRRTCRRSRRCVASAHAALQRRDRLRTSSTWEWLRTAGPRSTSPMRSSRSASGCFWWKRTAAPKRKRTRRVAPSLKAGEEARRSRVSK